MSHPVDLVIAPAAARIARRRVLVIVAVFGGALHAGSALSALAVVMSAAILVQYLAIPVVCVWAFRAWLRERREMVALRGGRLVLGRSPGRVVSVPVGDLRRIAYVRTYVRARAPAAVVRLSAPDIRAVPRRPVRGDTRGALGTGPARRTTRPHGPGTAHLPGGQGRVQAGVATRSRTAAATSTGRSSGSRCPPSRTIVRSRGAHDFQAASKSNGGGAPPRPFPMATTGI